MAYLTEHNFQFPDWKPVIRKSQKSILSTLQEQNPWAEKFIEFANTPEAKIENILIAFRHKTDVFYPVNFPEGRSVNAR